MMRAQSTKIADLVFFGPDTRPEDIRTAQQTKPDEIVLGSQSTPSTQYRSEIQQRIEVTQSDPIDVLSTTKVLKSKDEATVRSRSVPAARSQIKPGHPAIAKWHALWHHDQHTWNPRLLQLRPLVGLAAICVIVVCAFASLIVLLTCDGQATVDWSLSPSTTLAIITAVANSAVALAYMEAVPISWWYSTTRGRSIGALERQWQVSRSAIMASVHLRSISLLNLACIAAAFVVIDGPLLQKASTVTHASQSKSVMLDINLLPELPNGFSGTVRDGRIKVHPGVQDLAVQYANNDPIVLSVHGCPMGTCYASVQAPGVARSNCHSRTWQITPDMLHSINASWGEWRETGTSGYGLPQTTLSAFFVDLSTSVPSLSTCKVAKRQNFLLILSFTDVDVAYDYTSSAAELNVGLAQWQNLRGAYVLTTCFLIPAIAEYDIVIHDDGTVTLRDGQSQGRIISIANNTASIITTPEATRQEQLSTIDGLTVQAALIVDSNMTVSLVQSFNPDSYYSTNFTTNFNQFAQDHLNYSAAGPNLSWHDPTDDIIYIMNEHMFRAAVLASGWHEDESLFDPGITMKQSVSAIQKVTHNVYKSDLRWWAGAAVTQLITALLILPMFWGWWKIQCSNNLSPCAIALAFDSPILRDVNSASRPREIVNTVGALRLKYGAVGGSEGHGLDEDGNVYASGRLGIGEIESVVKPRKGMVFLR